MAAPMAGLVNISTEFLAAIAVDVQQGGVSPSAGLAVGVELVPNLQVFPASPGLTLDEVTEAARIYLFDMISQNADRRPESPNCGRADGRIVPFDFENAFSFRLAILKSDPWRISGLTFANKHLFFHSLQEHGSEVKWGDVFAPFESVPAGAVANTCGTISAAWHAIGAAIHAHFEAVFAHWLEFKREVFATLGVSP
ncbi:MAG: hypothetical protein NTV05_13340 [Acidobacteria bacterium]|nr:hypothetical protein [Acidobacteriota bacterium]